MSAQFDQRTIIGFVKRPDGYWYLTEDGTLHSTSPETGERMLKHIHKVWCDGQVPQIKEDIGYCFSITRKKIYKYILDAYWKRIKK
jgi:hypothetical protein